MQIIKEHTLELLSNLIKIIIKMKKFFIAAIAVLAMTSTASAQDGFLPEKGSFSTEIDFNPFSNNFKTFKIDQLKGRYFVTDNDAVRLGIGFGVDSKKTTPNPDAEGVEQWSKSNTGFFSLNLGYERHFVKKGRVDLYGGLGLGFKKEFASAKSYFKNSDYSAENKVYNAVDENGSNPAGTSFGVDVFTGIDFYVYKGLYVGAELGLNLKATNCPGFYTESYNSGTQETVKTDKQNKINGFEFSTVCQPALRLGWTF